jgi:hypothetical protein
MFAMSQRWGTVQLDDSHQTTGRITNPLNCPPPPNGVRRTRSTSLRSASALRRSRYPCRSALQVGPYRDQGGCSWTTSKESTLAALANLPAVSRVSVHHPKVVHLADGRWEVHCSECERFGGEPMPLGIGMPISREVEARAIQENHAQLSRRRGYSVGVGA